VPDRVDDGVVEVAGLNDVLDGRVCHERREELHVGRASLMRCCVEDEGLWPFGAALRGEAPNHPLLR